jgi:hypothetical protein
MSRPGDRSTKRENKGERKSTTIMTKNEEREEI